jgi:hypothetical protein
MFFVSPGKRLTPFAKQEVPDISTGEQRGITNEFCPLNPKSVKSGPVKSRIYFII